MRTINYVIILILMIPAFTSCKNEANEAEENTAAETAVHNCYQYVSKSDTIKMDITIEDNHVSGSLVYNFYEKDKNTGTIKGELRGDKLTAIYSFMSEGVKSTRQVIFQKNGEAFTEGYYVDGNYTITDFPGTVVLKKIQCE
jgi:hypothetical protein